MATEFIPTPENGRPTLYKSEYSEQAEKICKLGATDKDLSEFFEVCEATINNWKHEYPDFLESIKRGKQIADMNVAESLYKRATGYEHEDIHFSAYEGCVSETPYIKHYAPDPTSMIFWLKNRQPNKWRDKQETELSTKDGQALIQVITTNGKD